MCPPKHTEQSVKVCPKIISPVSNEAITQTHQTQHNAHDNNSMLDLFIYIHHIYRIEGASAEHEHLSGSFSNREMHFGNRLMQEAASTFGFLIAHAVIHDHGRMIVY